MTEQMKADILKHLKLVPTETLWGLGIQLFVQNVELKTDEDYEKVISDLQSQIQDCGKHMKIILGESFEFFKEFKTAA